MFPSPLSAIRTANKKNSARYNRIICQTVENTSFLERLSCILHSHVCEMYQGYKSNFGFHVFFFDLEIRQIRDRKSVFGFTERNTPYVLLPLHVKNLSLRLQATQTTAPLSLSNHSAAIISSCRNPFTLKLYTHFCPQNFPQVSDLCNLDFLKTDFVMSLTVSIISFH